MKAPFPIDPALMAIAIAFKNQRMIADEVLPRSVVGKQEFKYLEHAMAEGFTIPDTKVGRKSQPNQVEFSATEKTGSTEDYGLDDPIPQADIDNAPPNYNPLGRATEGIMNLVELDREVRVAGTIFNANTYGANNKVTLAGTDQFSDFVNSDPLGVLTDALDSMIMRANIMTIGRPVFSFLARHPQIVKAVHGNSGDSGIARRRDIADLLELEDILVGEAYVNTARKGQAMSLSRTWGKHIALTYRDKTADTRNGVTFGVTAQFGSRISGTIPDKDIGLRGGQRVRAGESVKEVICAADLGYFIQDAVA
ncbi:MAG: phage capsid protein [Proteobacteria bacterium]|nr:phage capsid protein [Pseudomonadota bacterium]MBU1058457.1 phage capsid protein [Pseudomonadota bacterium]